MKHTKKIAAIAACACMAMTSMVGMGASAEYLENDTDIISSSESDETAYSTNDVTAKLLAVPFCNQETNYYCAAATFQQVFAYYRGINNAMSQRTIAALIGVTEDGLQDMSQLTYWLNRYFVAEGVDYTWKWKKGEYSSSSGMKSFIKTSIDLNVPVIIHVNKVQSYDWGYSTSGGHYLNASGYTTDYIQLTDPYFDGHQISNGKYTVTNALLYKYCDRMAITE